MGIGIRRSIVSWFGLSLVVALLVIALVPVARATPVESLRPTNAAEADALRESLTRFVWADGLPTRLPDAVTTGVQADPWTPINNLLRVDRLTIRQPNGVDSFPLLFWPASFNGRAFIYHGGHDALANTPRNIANVHYLLTVGYAVLVVDMPMYGPNAHPGFWHGGLFVIDTPSRHALAWLLEPVVVGVNHLRATIPGIPIAMTGYSGGGWTTAWAAALDARITHSYPVAGSLPLPIREPKECGDEEQYLAEIYGPSPCDQTVTPGWLNYSELYALAGQGRASVQINNRYDGCCFWGDRRGQYVPQIQAAMATIGGTFESHVDDTTYLHEISPAALAAMDRHDRGQPFEIIGTHLPPLPTAAPTSTPTSTPTATSTSPPPPPTIDPAPFWTATPVVYQPGSCAPRPPVRVQVAQMAGGLAVTVTSLTPIRQVTFGQSQNATTAHLSINGTTATFTVTRSGAGAYIVPFTVVDNCGPWQSFVGNGNGNDDPITNPTIPRPRSGRVR